MTPIAALIDYDGTFIQSAPNAHDVMIASALEAMKVTLGYVPKVLMQEKTWAEIFRATTGMTEAYLTQVIANRVGLSSEQTATFTDFFYSERARRIAVLGKNHEDLVYQDAFAFLLYLLGEGHIPIWVSGNPRPVMGERYDQLCRNNYHLSGWLNSAFINRNELRGVYGNEGTSRHELIQRAIRRLPELTGFQAVRDKNGLYLNVVYIGDTIREVMAALELRVPMLWRPTAASSVSFMDHQIDWLSGSFPPDDHPNTAITELTQLSGMFPLLSQQGKESTPSLRPQLARLSRLDGPVPINFLMLQQENALDRLEHIYAWQNEVGTKSAMCRAIVEQLRPSVKIADLDTPESFEFHHDPPEDRI